MSAAAAGSKSEIDGGMVPVVRALAAAAAAGKLQSLRSLHIAASQLGSGAAAKAASSAAAAASSSGALFSKTVPWPDSLKELTLSVTPSESLVAAVSNLSAPKLSRLEIKGSISFGGWFPAKRPPSGELVSAYEKAVSSGRCPLLPALKEEAVEMAAACGAGYSGGGSGEGEGGNGGAGGAGGPGRPQGGNDSD